jgi:hypothetical protein
MPIHAADKRNRDILKFININHFDVMGMAEINLAWHNLAIHDRLAERTRGWFQSKNSAQASLKLPQILGAYQVGGVVQWAINETGSRVIEQGSGPLGRWCW